MIVLERSSTAHMALLTATSAYGITDKREDARVQRKRFSKPIKVTAFDMVIGLQGAAK